MAVFLKRELLLLNGFSLENGINFIDSSDIHKAVFLQDINIKVDKTGININKTTTNTTKNLNYDNTDTQEGNKHIINMPFFFMLSELHYHENNFITLKKIIALGKINNPNIIE